MSQKNRFQVFNTILGSDNLCFSHRVTQTCQLMLTIMKDRQSLSLEEVNASRNSILSSFQCTLNVSLLDQPGWSRKLEK